MIKGKNESEESKKNDCDKTLAPVDIRQRTQEEILAKIKDIRDEDFFGFETSYLVLYLNYESAEQYLKSAITEKEWEPDKTDRESILKMMYEYMSFAWNKAINCRGISASRSMVHYSVWIWMLRDEEKFGDLEKYEYYGKDNLVKICEHYGWDASQWDDGIRVNSEDEKEDKIMDTHYDSTGKIVKVGDPVKFRGKEYTIKEFLSTKSTGGTSQIAFEEKQHTDEIADEVSIDLIST